MTSSSPKEVQGKLPKKFRHSPYLHGQSPNTIASLPVASRHNRLPQSLPTQSCLTCVTSSSLKQIQSNLPKVTTPSPRLNPKLEVSAKTDASPS